MESKEDRGPLILGTICAVTALSTVFSAGRLFVRGKLKGRLLLDDYLIVISVLCTWLTIVFQLLAVRAGNGRHLYTLTAEQRRDVAHWTIIGFVPGIISFATPKLATIDLLCRILLPSRGHRIFLWVLGWTCWVQLMITIVFLFVKCDGTYPSVSALGLGSRSTGHKDCLDPWININYDIYTGAFSAFVDLYLAVYPSVVLCKLRLSRGKKVGLSVALGFGFVSTVVAIYKCTMIPTLASPDFSYDSSTLVIWTCVEGSTIIIAACIPILKPLLDLFRAGCDQAASSAREGFSSRYRGPSAETGPESKNGRHAQHVCQDAEGHNLFRMGTRTGVIVGGSTRPSGARLKTRSTLQQHDQTDNCRSQHGAKKDAATTFCSSSSQDSILRTCTGSEDVETGDTEEAADVPHPTRQQPHVPEGRDAKKFDFLIQHGGIMRTDSIEISFKPASISDGTSIEVARAL